MKIRYLSSARSLIIIGIGLAAFFSGVFFAWPLYHKDFTTVGFAHASVIAEIADTPEARMKGLSGRRSLPEFNGMLFVMDKADYVGIWMKDMKFPIDILWIRNGVIVDMEENAPPPAPGSRDDMLPVYHPDVPADFVLEVRADFSRMHHVHIGDSVAIQLQGGVYAYAKHDDVGDAHLVPAASLSPLPAGNEYTIEVLRKETLRGGDFNVGNLISNNEAYDKYEISYRSGDLTISGVMNVPKGTPPQSGFPVLMLNHGLIPPAIYTTGRGSKREQDFFSRNGYVTIHPDYRGHASSSLNTFLHHDFYVGYTQDVAALLDAIEISAPAFIDPHRIGMWGHSMGGGIASRVMVLRLEVKAFVLFAPISADVEDNFYELTQEEIQWLHKTYGTQGDPIYRSMSPITYFNDVAAPVQIHVGTADTAVPEQFSEKIYNTLRQYKNPVELFVYPNEKHEFINDWPVAAKRALQFFDHYVKN